MSPAAIELLQAQPGWDVVVSNPKEYEAHLADCEAMIVRSAVKVKAETLAKAPKLRVIGRAGVGVDNVDLKAATVAGVLVMNTPGGNAVSVAEHTFALMLALARMVPAATVSTLAGKWEKKKFLGNELRGKTLGVIGMGNIGQQVVRRARGFEMRVLVADPYVNPQIAADLGAEIVEQDKLFAAADYISLHPPKTPETVHMLNAAAFARMKDGVRIINCARGELIEAQALKDALVSGKVAGAGLDVFEPEPFTTDNPLATAPNVVATPHIAGSTEEAQEIVGIRIVEQMAEYLNHGVAINAVNMPAITPQQYKAIGPYIALAERLGRFASLISTGPVKAVRVSYSGRIAGMNTSLLRNSALAGVLSRALNSRVNFINAFQLAGQRGVSVNESHEAIPVATEGIRVEVETEQGVTPVFGAVVLGKARLLEVYGIRVEVPLSGCLIFMRNHDVPGVIGHVGTVLGRNSVNIANFSLGRDEGEPEPGKPLRAVAVVEVDAPIGDNVIAELRTNPAVRFASVVTLD